MPEGEHFTPEMLDRNEHPHDPKWRAVALEESIKRLPDDVQWSVEQIRAQCGRVIAGDSGPRSESRSLAWFVQRELLDDLVPAIVKALSDARVHRNAAVPADPPPVHDMGEATEYGDRRTSCDCAASRVLHEKTCASQERLT